MKTSFNLKLVYLMPDFLNPDTIYKTRHMTWEIIVYWIFQFLGVGLSINLKN